MRDDVAETVRQNRGGETIALVAIEERNVAEVAQQRGGHNHSLALLSWLGGRVGRGAHIDRAEWSAWQRVPPPWAPGLTASCCRDFNLPPCDIYSSGRLDISGDTVKRAPNDHMSFLQSRVRSEWRAMLSCEKLATKPPSRVNTEPLPKTRPCPAYDASWTKSSQSLTSACSWKWTVAEI